MRKKERKLGIKPARFISNKGTIKTDINVEVKHKQKQLEKGHNEPTDNVEHDNDKEDKGGYHQEDKIERKS